MVGWEKIKLDEICDSVQYGYTESAQKEKVGPKFLRITDIVGDFISWDTVPYCSISKKDLTKYKLTRGDIVVARTGNTTGYAKLIRNDVESVFASYLIRFKVDQSKADSGFIGRLLESEIFKSYVWSIIGGSAQPGANAKLLGGFPINLPPLHTQCKIASILSLYDDLIENNLKRIKLLEEKAQLTYEEWFVRMKFPGHEAASINDETGLPGGWKKMSLHEVAEVNAKSIKKGFDGEIDYIDIASVSPGTIESTTRYEYSYAPGRAKRIVSHGDIIWSCVRPNRKSHAVIWNPKENLIASTGFCVITPKRLPTSYLLQFVTTNDYVGYLNNRAGGAAYPAVKAIDFKESTIVVPSENLITDFDAVFKNSLEVSWNLQNQNKLLKEARDILLPRLMTGMINVDQIKLENLQPTTA